MHTVTIVAQYEGGQASVQVSGDSTQTNRQGNLTILQINH
jgi:hypothetical protein